MGKVKDNRVAGYYVNSKIEKRMNSPKGRYIMDMCRQGRQEELFNELLKNKKFNVPAKYFKEHKDEK